MHMKQLLLCAAIIAGLFAGFAPTVSAQSLKKSKKAKIVQIEEDEEDMDDEDDDSVSKKKLKKEKKAKQAPSPVVPAVKKMKRVKGNANAKADYYIYLFSASWCGPCCKEMPNIVKSFLAYSSFARIRPPRGPRRVLWVVVVTISA